MDFVVYLLERGAMILTIRTVEYGVGGHQRLHPFRFARRTGRLLDRNRRLSLELGKALRVHRFQNRFVPSDLPAQLRALLVGQVLRPTPEKQ